MLHTPVNLVPPGFSETDHYIYLNVLKERNSNLFYELLLANMLEVIPILYTPTVGDACINYSTIWRWPEGIYVSIEHKGRIHEVLAAWPAAHHARISVVTDGSRILGLGDLGANGLPLVIGKLDLYIAGAGIKPDSTIPICLDLGTNNKKFIDDPLYFGLRRPRPAAPEMDEFMDEFMGAMADVFPQLVVQFEDFSTDNAFKYLERYKAKYRCFNDDIQGTGAVVLSGFLNAARLSSEASGLPLTEHKILFFGAGSAGVGVAKQLLSFFTLLGMTEEEAKSRIYTVDSKGLITSHREGLQEHKKFFARTDYDGPDLTKLTEIIEYVKPTALLGLSTLRNAFTEDVVKAMAALNKRPIIFPLSNPARLCEVDFEDAVKWTDGKVIFASGGPFKPVEHEGKKLEPGQGNNMYIFPAIGFGGILCKARHITDGMVEQAAIALAKSLEKEELAADLVYPRLERIRDISATIALAVVRRAQADGVDENLMLRELTDHSLLHYIQIKMWSPPPSHSNGSRL